MESKDFSQEMPMQVSISSGSSLSSSSLSSSTSVDSHVDTSLNYHALDAIEIKTIHAVDVGGDDAGSENEGFMSGEEEFESAVDRPIVGYPDEETLGNSVQGEFSAAVSVRPIAKVSVDSDVEDDEDVPGDSRIGIRADERVGRTDEVASGVVREGELPEIKGSEVEIPEEKGEKGILMSGKIEENSAAVAGEGGDIDVQEVVMEFSDNFKEGKAPESLLSVDIGSVSEESDNAGKQVSEGVQMNDDNAKLQNNVVSDGGQEEKMDKESLMAEKHVLQWVQSNDETVKQQNNVVSDGGQQEEIDEECHMTKKHVLQRVQSNDESVKKQNNVVADGGEEEEMDRGSLMAGTHVLQHFQLNDETVKQLNNVVPDGRKEEEMDKGSLMVEKHVDGGIKFNDEVSAEDGEQLKELETGASVDNRTDLGEQTNSEASEQADGFGSGDLDVKTLNINSLGTGTVDIGNMEEIKDLESINVNSVDAKLDNGFDNIGNEVEKFVDHNVLTNSVIDSRKLDVTDEVVKEEALHKERDVIAGIAEVEKSADMDVEDQQHEELGTVTVNEQTMSLLDSSEEAGIENDSKDCSKDREIMTDEVEAEPSQGASDLVKETILNNASVEDIRISDTPEIVEPVLEEVDEEKHHLDEGDIDGSVTDGETEGVIFGSSEATKQFLEELERGSGAGSHSGAESSHDHSQRIDGQIVTDSDEVDTDDEGDGKELFDSAALAALLKAARDAGSDGAPITLTAQDGSRLFSIERPAGLGSSLTSAKHASRSSRPHSFTPSNLGMGDDSENKLSEEEKNKLQKLQEIRVNFLRLVQRLGVSLDDSLVAQVLYRFGLVAGRSTYQLFSFDNAKNTAIQLEAEGEDLDFSLNILVLGKTGVGKSATINSIFGEEKTPINAFGPGTTMVKEIVGVVGGVKLRIFDSPGLKSSSSERSINHKILSSIKNLVKKFPPDIVLYVDRLDNQTRDLNDLLLLKSISSTLGSSIWKNAIITLTHAASAPPDGPSGPLGYDVFIAQRSHLLQQTVAQAVGDLRILNPTSMNPVSLVENHPSCRKNRDGQKVLPNGQSWRPHLLLLCYSIKILAEVGSLSKTPESFDHRKLFGLRARSPPLPYLLSGLLQSRTHPKLASDQSGENGDSDIDLADLSDSDQEEEEDEYDQLPPFKPLRKSQIAKLSKAQRKAYFEEYDYRVKLLQKKQWKEELKRMRDIKKKGLPSVDDYGYMGEDDQENGSPAAVQVPLPDMALPPSFDGDNPAYRYRFLEPTSQFLARPVLDTHGWDHDCGYDGVNLEHSMAIASRLPAAVAVQITKDKKEFNIHLDSSVSAKHGERCSTMAGFDIQNIGRQLAYIVRGETKFKSFRMNKTAAGISVTFLGENVCTGFKVEDQITLGKRVVLVGSTGTVRSQGDSAFGANLEMRLREGDYPIGQDQSSLGLSLVKWRGDMALGANFQSHFSIGRSYKMAVRAGLNNKLSGQISVRTSSSDQLQIALLAILPVARAIYNIVRPGVAENYSTY